MHRDVLGRNSVWYGHFVEKGSLRRTRSAEGLRGLLELAGVLVDFRVAKPLFGIQRDRVERIDHRRADGLIISLVPGGLDYNGSFTKPRKYTTCG